MSAEHEMAPRFPSQANVPRGAPYNYDAQIPSDSVSPLHSRSSAHYPPLFSPLQLHLYLADAANVGGWLHSNQCLVGLAAIQHIL